MGEISEAVGTDFQWVKAFRALEDVLREDEVLSRLGISWDTRRGESGEATQPSGRQLPWVALVPMELPLKPTSEIEDGGWFAVRIDMAVGGTNWDEMGNFAGAVFSALKQNKIHRGVTVDAFMRSNGVWHCMLVRAGVGVRRTESPPAGTGVAAPPPITDQFASAVVKLAVDIPNIE